MENEFGEDRHRRQRPEGMGTANRLGAGSQGANPYPGGVPKSPEERVDQEQSRPVSQDDERIQKEISYHRDRLQKLMQYQQIRRTTPGIERIDEYLRLKQELGI